jgi:hypothetical protein
VLPNRSSAKGDFLKYQAVKEKHAVKALAPWLRRTVGICLIACLELPVGGVVTAHAQQSPQASSAPADQSEPQTSKPVPDAPAPAGAQTSAGQTNPSGAATLPQNAQEPPKPQNGAPVGTAVAPYEKGVGVAASRPAGAVIAPAKQKRTRSFVIKVGLLVGAAAAIGTVVALSNASPSRPH